MYEDILRRSLDGVGEFEGLFDSFIILFILPLSSFLFFKYFMRVNTIKMMTIIMISHDIAAAKKYASHILHIKNDPSFTEKNEYFASGRGNEFSIVRGKEE